MVFGRIVFFCTCGLAAWGAFAQPAIYIGAHATAVERDAAYELQGFLHLLTGDSPAVVEAATVPADATGAVLGTPETLPGGVTPWPFGLEAPRGDGFVLRDAGGSGEPLILVGSAEAIGVRHGVMALAERMGAGLSLGRTVFPAERRPFAKSAPGGIAESASPAIARRGMAALHSHLMGAAAWDEADYQAYIDGLVRLRMTTFTVFATADTPFAAYRNDGAWVGGSPLATTAVATWARPAMDTTKFLGGTGAYFAATAFGAPSRAAGDGDAAFADAQALLAGAFDFAARRGLDTALAVSVDGDPTDAATQEAFAAQLAHIARTYPMLAELWVLGPPGADCANGALGVGTWRNYAEDWSGAFGDDDAMAGAQLALFAMQAHSTFAALLPGCRIGAGRLGDSSPTLAAGLRAVLPEAVSLLGPESVLHALETDGDLWMPQPGLAEVRAAVEAAIGGGASGMTATHWRIKEPALTAGYYAALMWEPTLTAEAYVAERAPRFFPVAGEEAAPWVTELSALGYRWIGGVGPHERYPFFWSPGSDASRARLARAALELRQRIGEKGRLEAILPEDILLGWLPERLPGLRDALDLTLRPTRFLFGGGRPAPPEGLMALYDRVAFAIAFDYAATRLAPGPAPLATGGFESIESWIGRSRLATAMHTYVRDMSTKNELGVLASMNARAWGGIIDEYEIRPETISALTAAAPDAFTGLAVRVLPGQIIVTGAGAGPYEVAVLARNGGGERFLERPAEAIGPHHYAVSWPEGLAGEGLIEYGVEVRSRTYGTVTWPRDFPARWATLVRPGGDALRPPAAASGPAARPDLAAEIDAGRRSVRLRWNSRPGERYEVLRNGALLARTYAGLYEDRSAPPGVTAQYTVRAEALGGGDASAADVRIDAPPYPEPAAPSDIGVSSRGGRIVLSWVCDEPLASGYRIEQLDEDLAAVGATDVPAAPGRRISASFPARSAGNAFRIRPLGLDGTPGTRIRRFGVRPIAEEVPAAFTIDGDSPSVLEQIGVMTQRGFTIGGPGVALPAGTARWDRSNPFTLTLWVKLESADGKPFLICRGALPAPDMAMYVAHGRLHFALSGFAPVCGGTLGLGEWRMATATYDRGQIDLYVDGEPSGTGGKASGAPLASDSEMTGIPASVFETDGLIDRAAFFEAALTPQEIKALMDAERGQVE